MDELYNVTSGTDKFTFGFDHASSNMLLNCTGSSIHIYGDTYGGRDIGSAYANATDPYQGVYKVDFLYNMNVANAPGSGGVQDVWVTGNMTNFGTIMTPLGDTFNLADKSNATFTFQLGDEGGGALRKPRDFRMGVVIRGWRAGFDAGLPLHRQGRANPRDRSPIPPGGSRNGYGQGVPRVISGHHRAPCEEGAPHGLAFSSYWIISPDA